jgi:hypothetical protein
VSTKKILVAAIVGFAVTILAPTPARATSIGAFSFVVDPELGPILSVENFSAGTFSDVVIHLLGTTDTTDLTLGVVDPFALQQTTEDLTALPFPFDRATLDLTYSLTGSLTLNELTGLSFSADDAAGYIGPTTSVSIDFEAPPPQPVPEPATILLVGAGALIAVRARAVRAKPREL